MAFRREIEERSYRHTKRVPVLPLRPRGVIYCFNNSIESGRVAYYRSSIKHSREDRSIAGNKFQFRSPSARYHLRRRGPPDLAEDTDVRRDQF